MKEDQHYFRVVLVYGEYLKQ